MEKKQNNMKSKLIKLFKHDNTGIALILLSLCVVTTIINPNFVSSLNLINLARKISQVGFMAICMTFVMIGGGIDLSAGRMAGLGGIIAGTLMVSGMPVFAAVIITIVLGGVFGLVNGYFIAKVKIPAFIVTLGTMYIAEGIVNVISKGKPIFPLPDTFTNVFSEYTIGGLSLSVYMLIVFAVVMHYVLNHTVYGRSITAAGGNERASVTAGINCTKIKMLSYVILSAASAFTGLLIAARMKSGHPSSGGGWELTAIAAAVIGSTSVNGGSGSITGTLIGASIMAVLEIAMTMMKISVYYQNIIVGVIIIGAVVFDQYKKQKKA